MKNFLLGVLFLCAIGAIAFLGYKAMNARQNYDDSVVEEVVQEQSPGILSTPAEAVLYKEQLCTEHYYDSVFMSMPDEIINDVASALIRDGFVTVPEIVEEYKLHRAIYDGIYNNRTDHPTDNEMTAYHPRDDNKKQEITNDSANLNTQ